MIGRTLVCTVLAAYALLVSCSQPKQAETTSQEAAHPVAAAVGEEQRFDVEQLKSRIDAGEDIFLLDVRRPDELAEHGTIEGSVNIPIDELAARLAEVPKDKPIAVYCMRGGRASRATALLEENGHENIEFGGITAWKEKGYPVVYPEGSSTSGTRGSSPR